MTGQGNAAEQADFATARIERMPHPIATRVEDGILLVDTESGNFIELNRTASVLWDALDAPATRAELCAVMLDRFDVAPDRCAAQVEAWLTDMAGRGLVRISTDEACAPATAQSPATMHNRSGS